MNKILAALLATTIVFSSPIVSADGADLMNWCSAIDAEPNQLDTDSFYHLGYCHAFIHGVTSTALVWKHFDEEFVLCNPPDGATRNQSARVVLNFLKKNPTLLDENEAVLILQAFKQTYKCR